MPVAMDSPSHVIFDAILRDHISLRRSFPAVVGSLLHFNSAPAATPHVSRLTVAQSSVSDRSTHRLLHLSNVSAASSNPSVSRTGSFRRSGSLDGSVPSLNSPFPSVPEYLLR